MYICKYFLLLEEIISIIQMLSEKQQKQILFKIECEENSFLYLFFGGK